MSLLRVLTQATLFLPGIVIGFLWESMQAGFITGREIANLEYED